MRSEMSSRERVLTAINCREPDHVPFLNRGGIPYKYWWTLGRDEPFRDQFERVIETLKLGIDGAVSLSPPIRLNRDVKVRVRKEKTPSERYPILIKEYETPKGTLRRVCLQTPDWAAGDDIPFFNDLGAAPGRAKKYLVENEKDLEVLSYLFREPTGKETDAFREEAERVESFAEKHDVPIICHEVTHLGSAAMWLCGFTNAAVATIRKPDFLHRLLDIIHGWNIMKARLLLECGGVDMIVHYAWYEGTEFWSPKAYRTFLMPRLKEEIELVHKYKAKFGYTLASGAMPLLGMFKEMGIDVLYGIDQVQGGYDLKRTKQGIGDSICLWGGVNSHVTLTNGTREDVKRAVREAISTLGPGGGFILSSVGTMSYPQIPIENIRSMIDAWRKMANYSIPA